MKIAVAIIHGMGSQKKGFSEALQRGIASHYASLDKEWDQLIFQEVLWADILEPQQETLFNRLTEANRLDFQGMRHFLVNRLGDVVGYEGGHIDEDPNSHRFQIHKRLDEALKSFEQVTGVDGERMPLVMIGHSLGTVIMFNHLWQMQHHRLGTAFDKGHTLAGFVTLGSPLALWTLRYKDLGRPFEFPGRALTSTQKAQAKWINLYDRDDILAYPLKSINAEFNEAVTADIEVNAGGLLDSWNPLSHNAYWEDKDVHQHISKFLVSLV